MLTITPNQTLPQNCGNLAPIINKSPSLILCPQKVEIFPPPLPKKKRDNLTPKFVCSSAHVKKPPLKSNKSSKDHATPEIRYYRGEEDSFPNVWRANTRIHKNSFMWEFISGSAFWTAWNKTTGSASFKVADIQIVWYILKREWYEDIKNNDLKY